MSNLVSLEPSVGQYQESDCTYLQSSDPKYFYLWGNQFCVEVVLASILKPKIARQLTSMDGKKT